MQKDRAIEPRPGRAPRAAAASPAARRRDLEVIREIVVGPERARLDRLEARPRLSAEAVAECLPEAIAEAYRVEAERLGIACEPPVTQALRAVARHEAELFAELLAPTLGASVRKAVSDAISAMLQRFNEALERSLSLRSLRWRLEARRTQRPFAEVVLLRTLVYRVEQAFLIQPGTGVVLQHVIADGVVAQDPDQVAALLEAIDAFVREAFRPQGAGEHLTSVRVGDVTVWVERDAKLIVAAVVRGVAPPELGKRLQEARERIYLRLRDEVEAFRSDTTPFVAARPHLAEVLVEQRAYPPRRAQRWLVVLLIVVAGGVVAGLVHRQLRSRHRGALLARYNAVLAAEPGVVITDSRWAEDRVRLTGFRDPLARTPQEVFVRHGLPPSAEPRLAPYLSLDPRIVERRARQALRPPAHASVVLHAGTLQVAGRAPRAWIDEARQVAPRLPGVDAYDDRALRSEEALDELARARSRVEQVSLPFRIGTSALAAPAAVAQASQAMRALTAAARAARVELCVVILGRADASGPYARNLSLAAERARASMQALVARGVAPEHVRPRGAGVAFGAASAAEARRTGFRAYVGVPCRELP